MSDNFVKGSIKLNPQNPIHKKAIDVLESEKFKGMKFQQLIVMLLLEQAEKIKHEVK